MPEFNLLVHTYVRGHTLLIAATAKASQKKEAATVKYIELEEQGKTLAAEKSEVEAALAEALPALEAARFALSQLDKSDITEIRLRMHASFNMGLMIKQIICHSVIFIFILKPISLFLYKLPCQNQHVFRILFIMQGYG